MNGDGTLELFINNPDFRDVVASNLQITDKPLYFFKLNSSNKFVLDSAYKNSTLQGIKTIDYLGQVTQCKYENRDPSLSRGVLIDQTPYAQTNGVGTFYLCNNDTLTFKNLSDSAYGLKHRVQFFDTDKLRGFTLSGKEIKMAQPGNYQINLIDEYFCTVGANNPGIKVIKINAANEAKKLAPNLTLNGALLKLDSLVCQPGNINDGSVLIGTNAPNTYKVAWADLNVDTTKAAKIIGNKIEIGTGAPFINIAANVYDTNKCYYKIPKVKITNQGLNYNPIKLNIATNTTICYTDSILLTLKKPLSISNISFTIFNNDTVYNKQVKGDTVLLKEKGVYYYKIRYPNNCYYNTDSLALNITPTIPNTPTIARDAENNLVSSHVGDNLWYKDGILLQAKTTKIKPDSAGNYTVRATAQGCQSGLSSSYYYLITDIINLSSKEYIKLAPNPFINLINLDYNIRGYGRLNIEVVSITTGKILYSLKGMPTGTPISLANLSSGVYLIKVSSNDFKIVHQFKMVKM
jgi:hypothetical protein